LKHHKCVAAIAAYPRIIREEVLIWEKAINAQNAERSFGEPMERVVRGRKRKRKKILNIPFGNCISSFPKIWCLLLKLPLLLYPLLNNDGIWVGLREKNLN